jgi:hypothetical protein
MFFSLKGTGNLCKHFVIQFGTVWLTYTNLDLLAISVAEPELGPEPELKGAASFGWSWSRNTMRLRLRRLWLQQWY